MHIVMIGPFAFKPKATVSARAFLAARALVKRGQRVTILMPPYDHRSDSGRSWVQDGVRLENIRLWPGPLTPLIAAGQLVARALALQPDIIHVFKPIAYSGLAAQILAARGRPWVLDHDDWEGRGGWADVNPYPWLWKKFFYWQEPWVLRHAPAVTVASRTLQTQAWSLGLDPARVFYAPNGPDESMRRAPAALPGAPQPTAIYLGVIPHGNDLDQALEAAARLRPEFPNLRLVIAGVGDGLPALQALAIRKGLGETVQFPGWIDPPRVPEVLRAADVALYPYRDSLINRAKCSAKLIAYMAAGLPIVASRVGQSSEYLEHGLSGWLVEPGQVDDLVRAWRSLLVDRKRAQALGQAAQQRLWERFDWDVLIERFTSAYQASSSR